MKQSKISPPRHCEHFGKNAWQSIPRTLTFHYFCKDCKESIKQGIRNDS
ncbi:hypothetical protein [Helicobacter sp.]|nr:hypothetical protein [Helicobacter sp.]MBD5165696.1 hypothetical protein [Helicobacter sp.]